MSVILGLPSPSDSAVYVVIWRPLLVHLYVDVAPGIRGHKLHLAKNENKVSCNVMLIRSPARNHGTLSETSTIH